MEEYLKTLPQFLLSVKEDEEDETNVYITSIVDEPAMMRDFAKFSKGSQKLFFKEQKDRRILSGVWVLADTPIYRKYNDFEFTVVFNKVLFTSFGSFHFFDIKYLHFSFNICWSSQHHFHFDLFSI